MVVYKSLESERNDLGHGCFGICQQDPDLLLWIALKYHVHFQVDTLSKADSVKLLRRHPYLRLAVRIAKCDVRIEPTRAVDNSNSGPPICTYCQLLLHRNFAYRIVCQNFEG
jgi:hypothetical protein